MLSRMPQRNSAHRFGHRRAASGSKSANGTLPSWTSWAAGNETVSHVSFWTASSGGTYAGSAALSASKAMTNGDSLSLTAITASVSPLAA